MDVKIMVPFWVPIIVRHLIFRVPKKGTIILTTTHILLRSNTGVYGLEDYMRVAYRDEESMGT